MSPPCLVPQEDLAERASWILAEEEVDTMMVSSSTEQQQPAGTAGTTAATPQQQPGGGGVQGGPSKGMMEHSMIAKSPTSLGWFACMLSRVQLCRRLTHILVERNSLQVYG